MSGMRKPNMLELFNRTTVTIKSKIHMHTRTKLQQPKTTNPTQQLHSKPYRKNQVNSPNKMPLPPKPRKTTFIIIIRR